MNIYFLNRENNRQEQYRSKIIVAENEARAREIANEETGDEGQVWQDESLVTCVIVDANKEGVVCSDYYNG